MPERLKKKQKKFVRKNYPALSVEEIAKRLGVDAASVKQAIKELGKRESASSAPQQNALDRFFDRYAAKAVFFFIAFYVMVFSAISVLRYNAFDYNDFDFAIFAQATWNILHGSIECSILGVPFLGNHLSIILFLIAPLYAVFNNPVFLLVLQTLLLGSAASFVYLLAKDNIGSAFACLFSLLYLIYPGLLYVNMYEFHPEPLAAFFLLGMFYYFEKERFRPFLLFMILALSCQENISAAVLFFGVYALLFKERSLKWYLAPAALGGLCFLAALKLIPYFNKGALGISDIYGHLGSSIPNVIGNIINRPSIVINYIAADINRKFLFQIFAPMGFISVLSPKVLFIGLPFFLQQLLSGRFTDHLITYHYTAKLLPFLFVGAVYATRFLLGFGFVRRHRYVLFTALLIASVASNASFGYLPQMPGAFRTRYLKDDIDRMKQKFVDMVPKDASVIATFEFLPKLSRRKNLYSLHHQYMGRYTLSTKEYRLPEGITYALIDFNDYLTFTSFYQPENYKKLLELFGTGSFNLVSAAENVALFKKEPGTGAGLFRKLEAINDSAAYDDIEVEDDVILRSYSLENKTAKGGDTVRLTLSFECVKETDRHYWAAFRLVDSKNKEVRVFTHPILYQVYPSYSWKKGEIYEEDIYILMPFKHAEKDLYIKMGIFWRDKDPAAVFKATGAKARCADKDVFDREGWINIGKIKGDAP